jgi:hypothetical protein
MKSAIFIRLKNEPALLTGIFKNLNRTSGHAARTFGPEYPG